MKKGTTPEFPGWYVKFQVALLEQAPRPAEIGQAAAKEWTKDQDNLKSVLAKALLPSSESDILRLISGDGKLILDATDGTETIPKSGGVFVYIDPDFNKWDANEPSSPTDVQPIAVYEMVQDATFKQMFESMSGDINKFCLTQSQILAFVRKHRKWLRTDGYATFFLFKSKGKFFVAYVHFFSDPSEPHVRVDGFEDGDVWNAGSRHRVVLPQL